MKTVLCYGDSNTFGYDVHNDGRFAHDVRWPGILKKKLGKDWLVIEEGLNHRTTALDDPSNEGRNGAAYLLPCLHSHRPLDLVIIMLGSNDMKAQYNRDATEIAAGISRLVDIVQASQSGCGGAAPEILLLPPPLPGKVNDYADLYAGIEAKAALLPALYRAVAQDKKCLFLDTSSIRCPIPDGIHLGAAEHRRLGEAVVALISNSQPA